jgi:hypothetical protein
MKVTISGDTPLERQIGLQRKPRNDLALSEFLAVSLERALGAPLTAEPASFRVDGAWQAARVAVVSQSR